MEYKIIHLEDKHRFETEVEGYVGYVVYRVFDGCLDIVHTIVPQPIEGRGVAASLVKAAYTYALENNLRPQGTCSYAAVWLKRHPEYKKLF